MALSMLPSWRQRAYARTRAVQEEATRGIRDAESAVVGAKWMHFQKCLHADYAKLDAVVGACSAIEALQHTS